MKIELHMIQNFAPSCLNRDDTNSPKDCIFGGYRRARISSQCIKRAIRDWWSANEFKDLLGKRTNKLIEDIAGSVAPRVGADQGVVLHAAKALVANQFVKKSKVSKQTGKLETSYMVFLSEDERKMVEDYLASNWGFESLAKDAEKAASTDKKPKGKTSEPDAEEGEKTKEDKSSIAKTITRLLKEKPMSRCGISADIALFGRMLADYPKKGVDAACQVAHAISTNKIEMEMDFFTAVDDLKTDEEDAGAGMMGVIGFNSACFYRYAVLDYAKLLENLGGDEELTEKTVEAFLRASATAIPTGKQNTFAAHNPPDLIMANIRRKGAPVSLANAFVRPVRPTNEANLTMASVNEMKAYWDRTLAVYGSGEETDGPYYCGIVSPTDGGPWKDAVSLDGLITKVMGAIRKKEDES